jgi:hypothetical protein
MTEKMRFIHPPDDDCDLVCPHFPSECGKAKPAETLATRLREFADAWEANCYGDRGLRVRAETAVRLARQSADEIERLAATVAKMKTRIEQDDRDIAMWINAKREAEATVARLTAERDSALIQSQENYERAHRAELLWTVTEAEHPDKAALAAETVLHMERADEAEARATAAETREMELRAQLAAHREPYVAAGLTPAAEGGVTG